MSAQTAGRAQEVAFEGSPQQRRILKLREVEGRLDDLKTVAQLLLGTAESREDEIIERAAEMMIELATQSLEHLGMVER